MSKSIKRVLAMLLSVCMVVGMMPTLAFAGLGDDGELQATPKFRGDEEITATAVALTGITPTSGEEVELQKQAMKAGASDSDYTTALAVGTSGKIKYYLIPNGDKANVITEANLGTDDSKVDEKLKRYEKTLDELKSVELNDGDVVFIQTETNAGGTYKNYMLKIKETSKDVVTLDGITIKGFTVLSGLNKTTNGKRFNADSSSAYTALTASGKAYDAATGTSKQYSGVSFGNEKGIKIVWVKAFPEGKISGGNVDLTELTGGEVLSSESEGKLYSSLTKEGGVYWIVVKTLADNEKDEGYTVFKATIPGIVADVTSISLNGQAVDADELKKSEVTTTWEDPAGDESKISKITLPYTKNDKKAESTLAVEATSGVTVEYKLSNGDEVEPTGDQRQAPEGQTSGNYTNKKDELLDLKTNDTVNILVKSADGTSVKKYYTIRVEWAESAALEKIAVEGEEKSTGLEATGVQASPLPVEMTIPYNYDKRSLKSLNVTLTGPEGAKYRTIVATDTPNDKDWAKVGQSAFGAGGTAALGGKNFSDGRALYIEVETAKGIQAYYKLTVAMEQTAADVYIKNVKVTSGNSAGTLMGEVPEAGMTADAPAEVKAEVPAEASLASVNVEFEVPENAYKVYAGAGTSAPANYGSARNISDGKVKVTAQNFTNEKTSLYVRVVAQDGTTNGYYKINVVKGKLSVLATTKHPDVKTADLTGVVEDDQRAAVAAALNATSVTSTGITDLKNLAYGTAVASQDSWTDEMIKEKIRTELGTSLSADAKTYIYVGTYLDASVVSYNIEDAADKEYVLDLQPMYYVAASTNATGSSLKIKGQKGVVAPFNAVYLVEDTPLEGMESVPVSVSLPIEAGGLNVNPIYAFREGSNVMTKYDGTSGTITINAEGAGRYIITTDEGEPVARIGDKSYLTLQAAIDDVENGDVIELTEYAKGPYTDLKAPVTGKDAKVEFTIKPTDDVKLEDITFAPNAATDGYTYSATMDDAGKVTVTRVEGGSDQPDEPGPIEPSETGKLVFTDDTEEAALQDMATTVGSKREDRRGLKLKAEDDTPLEDVEQWTVTSSDEDIVHVTAARRLCFKDLGTATVTVTAKAKDSDATYSTEFTVNVTKLGVPQFTLRKGSKKGTWKITPKKVYGATGLTIRYSKSESKLDSSKWKHIKNSESAKTVKVAKSGKTYYVKARAYKKVDGKNVKYDWSATGHVKAK